MTQGGADDIAAVRASLRDHYVGSAYYAGGWEGAAAVQAAADSLQGQTRQAGSPGLLLAADQEGGQVRQLRGNGFTSTVSAVRQGQLTPSARRAYAASMGRQLRAAGLNVDLAPVADTVPAALGKDNGPIGAFDREYGNDPTKVAAAVSDVVHGFDSSGLAATLKHFPGIGRIAKNTDYSSSGITDSTTGPDDPYLTPFGAGIRAGAGLVMISSARYPKLDPKHPATFSAPIITGLLRQKMGFKGVVISDDLNTPALASTPVQERAVRFVGAGGDLLLTATDRLVPGLTRGLLARMASDPAFARVVAGAVQRVMTLKASLGLVRCG